LEILIDLVDELLG